MVHSVSSALSDAPTFVSSTTKKMKALITIALATILLASCTVENTCHSYGQTNRGTSLGKKAQYKYARHNKTRLLF